jgi:hypothetical protein
MLKFSLIPKTSCHTVANRFSVSLRGKTISLSDKSMLGSGKALKSILPLSVIGILAIEVKYVGII